MAYWLNLRQCFVKPVDVFVKPKCCFAKPGEMGRLLQALLRQLKFNAMKKHLLSILLATIWLCSLAQIPTSGLVQRFTFDGTLDGINGNTLSLFGQPNYVNDRFGNANSAQNLAGTSTSFNTAGLTNLPTGNANRTVSFWYKSNANTTHSLFNYGNNGGSATFAIAYTTGPNRLVLFNGNNEYNYNISYTGNWNHVAVVHNGGSSYVYLNGVQQGSATAVTYATTAGQTVNIGFSPGNTPYANFQMDELLVYNRALTPSEIVTLYNACGNPVNTTTVANQNICTGTATTLSVAGSNVSWYTTPSGSSPVATGNNFTTGVLAASTSYFAESAGCAVRTEVPVTVTQTAPPAPISTTQSAFLTRCSGATSPLSVSGSDSVRWYSAPTGGTVLGTGNTFVTPVLPSPYPNATGTVTYYAEAWNACGVSARTAINITVKATPDTPVNTTPADSLNICTGSSTTLSVSSTSGSVDWSTVSVTPNTVGTGLTFTTPTLTQTTQYAVYSYLNGCFSNEYIFTVNVSQSGVAAPTNNTQPTALSVCEGSTTSLSALSSGNTIYWYDASTGGNLLGTGSPFTTPVINDTTTYYAQAGMGSCASVRTPITVTTKFTPTGVIQLVNDTIRASNLYNSYVLRKDTTIIASSNTTGSFAIPVTQCGDYQATFTNPTNNCPNISVSVSKAYLPNSFYCEARITLSGVTFPVEYSMSYTPNYATPTNVDNASPLNFPLTSNLTSCSAVSGMRYISVKTNTGCIYNFSFDAELPFGVYNTSATSSTDSTTTCSFTSNIVNVATVSLPAPSNTTAPAGLTICSGNTTTLSANGSGTLYWYDAPSGGTALGSGNIFTTPVLAANATYYVQSGNGACASARTAIPVAVNQTPVASISPAAVAICNGATATLTATGGGTYNWSNGGGTNAQATFSPTTTTSYTVTVTNAGCTATATQSIIVNTLPVAAVSPAAVSICNGASTTLTASGGSYSWSNSLGANAGVTVSPTATTTYTVTVTNANNCTATASGTVTVNNVAASINGPTTICSSLQATLTATGGTGYAWADNLGSNAAITVSPTATTTYIVTVTGAGNCTATASQTVSVQNTPTAVISGTAAICNGESATLTANGGNDYTWANGLGSNAAITVSPVATTTYTVTVSIGANCTATASQTVTVYQPGASSFSQTLCYGQSYTFAGNMLTTTGVYTDLLQTINGCDSIVTLNLNVLPEATEVVGATICSNQSYEFGGQQLTQAGQYFDTLQTPAGCDSFVVLNLNVVDQFATTLSAAICQGQSYEFNGEQLTLANSYTDTLLSEGGCDSIITLSLVVNSLPQPVISANSNVLNTQAFDSYQWLLDANEIQGATAQNYTATANGSYTVQVTDANGCSNTSEAIVVTGVGISTTAIAGIKFYPNPVENMLAVETPAGVTGMIVADVNGRVLFRTTLTAGKVMVNTAELPAGVLNVQFSSEQGIVTARLVKLR